VISFRGVALRRGGRLLLSGLDLNVHAGWRVGVIGRNGSGKSSLFAALKGELEPDAGSLDMPSDLRMAAVDQETPPLPETSLDFVLGGDAELHAAHRAATLATQADDHEAAAQAHLRIEALHGYDAEARAARLMYGLGFAPETHQHAVAHFSGGWRARLNLARALMTPSDLLLLDEPTNHLDLDAVLWLETWLLRYPGTLLLISHDREFLDAVCTQILHIEAGAARAYAGNYSAFERQRSEQLKQQQAMRAREQTERAHLQSFIDRFKAQATKAKQAQSRMKRLEKLGDTVVLRPAEAFRFSFPAPERQPESLLALDDAAIGYPGQEILENVRCNVQAGDRIGLLGRNGAGKSTLVKALVGELALQGGTRQAHKDMVIGYFAQHTVESLRAGHSAYAHLSELAPRAAPQVLRDWLGQWQFAGERAFEPVEAFSGGERARLALALIAWRKPNLLVLDEPTNHLDLDMREALAEALNDYPGALLLVAHDRHLLGLVCERFWRVHDGEVQVFDGDLDDYAALQSISTRSARSGTGKAAGAEINARERRRQAAQQREREKPLRQRLQKVESRLQTLAEALAALAQQLADPQLYANADAELTRLLQQQAGLHAEHAQLEQEWLDIYARLDPDTAA
jgi:ATP-binding cassette subfamily F protein 3